MNRNIWFSLVIWGFSLSSVYGQIAKLKKFVDADRLTITGKALTTPFPYHRVDTAVFKGLRTSENQQARCGAGLAIAFTTNSSFIDVHPTYKWEHKKDNITGMAAAGFDLYIKRDNKWIYAATSAPRVRDSIFTIVSEMDTSKKECLLYLPLYSELKSLKIGVQADATIKGILNPFKRKIVFFGSSFTQGISASRPGMNYPAQLQRKLDMEVCNLGFSGNAKLQLYFAEVLAAVNTEAIVLDAFSNPNEKMIRERLMPFLDIMMKRHKNIPVIFVETIHRGNTNFNLKSREIEAQKRKAAQELMAGAMKKYKSLFFISNPLPKEVSDETSADGVHPSDLGYFRWAETLANKLTEIIK